MLEPKAKFMKLFTLIYVVNNGKVLLLNKKSGSKYLENKWLGLGGKIENNEDILESAKREAKEEAGITIDNAKIQGTYSWSNEEEIALIYLIVARKFSGELLKESNEGTLEWHDFKKINDIKELAEHQKNFLTEIIENENYIYSSFKALDALDSGLYNSVDYFKSRKHRPL